MANNSPRMIDERRADFEKWALDYLQRQYPFYNAETIGEMVAFNRSPVGSLWDAWRAAWDAGCPS